jgi:hypothetical protein
VQQGGSFVELLPGSAVFAASFFFGRNAIGMNVHSTSTNATQNDEAY